MKLIYLAVDGKARLENWSPNKNVVEMPDGLHPVTNDGVWQDARRRKPPLMLMTQGAFPAWGSSMAHHDVGNVLYSTELAERAFRPQSVSKMWVRALVQAVRWFMASAAMLFVVAIIAYSLYQTYAG